MTWPARHNLYIVSLHALLVLRNGTPVLPTTYISLSLPGVNKNVYIDWWHAQLQTSISEIIIKYVTFHITREKNSIWYYIHFWSLMSLHTRPLYSHKNSNPYEYMINHSFNRMLLLQLQSKYVYFHWNIEKKRDKALTLFLFKYIWIFRM